MDTLIDLFSQWQDGLFESFVQPLAFSIGLGNRLEDAYDATGWLLVGLLQIAVMLAVIGPLQRWRPVDRSSNRAAVWTDVIYTLIHRLGVFRVAFFFTLEPLLETMIGEWRTAGYGSFHLEDVWPGVTDHPLLSLVLYLVVFDFINYWHCAEPVRGGGGHHSVERKLSTRQFAFVLRTLGRTCVGEPTFSSHTPCDWHRARRPAACAGGAQLWRVVALVGHVVWHSRLCQSR